MVANPTIDFEELKRELPYKWRVQSFSKFKPEATCVAYVDSRDVQKLLDEVVGPENWQDEYYEVKNNLFCRIGIRVNGEWTWKGDCGVESNVDKQKGEASDAFKRAAVKWGIARFLYDLGMYKLKTDKKLGESQGNPVPVEDNGQRIWDITKHINAIKAAAKPKQAPKAPVKKEAAPMSAKEEFIGSHHPENQAEVANQIEQEETGDIKYSTAKQKAEIIALLNNVHITRTEKTKTLLEVNKLDIERADACIAWLKKTIEKREKEARDAA